MPPSGRLRSAGLSQNLLVNRSVDYIITYCITAWFASSTMEDQKALHGLIKTHTEHYRNSASCNQRHLPDPLPEQGSEYHLQFDTPRPPPLPTTPPLAGDTGQLSHTLQDSKPASSPKLLN